MTQRPQDVVAAGYDAMVERYSSWQAQIVGDPRERYVQKLLSLVPERPDVLEIGCGAGLEPTRTFATVGRLVGIDISRAQIERARAAIPGAELIHGDVTAAVFQPESFDAIVALYVLTHIPGAELPGLLGHIAQWLRPRGVLLATFGSRRDESVVEDFLGAPMFFSGFDEKTNERLVREAGLAVLESRLETTWEPESEPGKGPEAAAFHWILARKTIRGAVRAKAGTVQTLSGSREEEVTDVPLEGGCACGEVRYRLTSEPLFTHCCHCLNCQRQTGSAFVINLLIEADRVELLAGDPQPIAVPRSGGKKQKIWRCPTCQVAVFSQYTSPRVRFVRGGTLDDPSAAKPDVHIFTRSKVPWVALPESVPAFKSYYDTKKLWPAASLERLEALMASKTS